MLRKLAFNAALPLAEVLASQAKTVSSKPNTLLSELDRTTNSLFLNSAVKQSSNDDLLALGAVLEKVTFNYDSPTMHDTLMDNFREDLVTAISSHLKFARNVVKPIVVDYATKLIQYIDGMKLPGPDTQYNLQMVEVPAQLKDMVFLDSIKKFMDIKNPESVRPVAACPIKAVDNTLLNYILTGDKEVDQLITEWYTSTLNESYPELVNGLISNPTAMIAMFGRGLGPHRLINQALIVYLLTNAVSNKEDLFDEAVNLSAAEKRNILLQYRNYAGSLVVRYLQLLENAEASQTVVLEISHSDKTLWVYGDTFRKWLQQGGRTEHLFALLSLKLDFRTADKLIANQERLQKEWDSYSLFWNNMQLNNRLTLMKNGVKLIFNEIMTTLSDEEQEYVKTHTDYMSSVNRKLETVANSLRQSDLNNVYSVALKIICQCRFYYTDAEFILSEMEEIAKTNPDITPDEAAMIATVHYVTDYLCDQMFVTGRF